MSGGGRSRTYFAPHGGAGIQFVSPRQVRQRKARESNPERPWLRPLLVFETSSSSVRTPSSKRRIEWGSNPQSLLEPTALAGPLK